MSSSSDQPAHQPQASSLPKLAIASAGDLFEALRSDSAGVRMSVLSAISRSPEKALSYGPHNGRDLMEELCGQFTAAHDRNYRIALLGAITAFDDIRVKEVLQAAFRTTPDAREAAVCAARLCCGPAGEVRSFFLPFIEDAVPRHQARLAADVLARFDDLSPDNRVRVAVLSSEAFPTPGLTDETEAAWLGALRGPFGHRAMGLLEPLGSGAFARLRRRWDEFTPELKAWLLGWGCRDHQAHAAELCLRALEEETDQLRLAALGGISRMGPAGVMFRPMATKFLAHPDPVMRTAAVRAGAVVENVRGMLSRETHMELRLLLIPLMASSCGSDAIPDLVDLLKDESWRIRNAAVTALISLGGAAAGAVERLAGSESVTVSAAAVQVLRGLNSPTA